MKKLKLLTAVIISILLLGVSPFLVRSQVQAFSLDDALKGVKSLFAPKVSEKKGSLAIASNISLAPNGDIDNNGEIDTGDTVRFEYIITNSSDTNYSWLTLKTNINRKYINYIHNVYGILNLKDDGKTLQIRNLRIPSGQKFTFGFDARINYSSTQDLLLSTEPELIDEKNSHIISSPKKELTAKKITPEKLEKMLEKGTIKK